MSIYDPLPTALDERYLNIKRKDFTHDSPYQHMTDAQKKKWLIKRAKKWFGLDESQITFAPFRQNAILKEMALVELHHLISSEHTEKEVKDHAEQA